MTAEDTRQILETIDRIEIEVERLERAVQFGFVGNARDGSFLKGTSTEYVPCVFVTVQSLKSLVTELRKRLTPPKIGEVMGLSEALIIVPSKT